MKTAVVALGGNAISPVGEVDTIAKQFTQTRKSLNAIIQLLKNDILPVISHGNGPQVGSALLRTEMTADKLMYLPLGICVADTEGGMGYMIEQSLQNRLRDENINRTVVTLVTQVVVSKDDPSITDPSKFIGPALPEEDARRRAKRFGWQIKPYGEDKWRRVVPSPEPIEIVNREAIRHLVENGHIVIAAGGGGVPVYYDEHGNLEGMDAVIDKDRASALMANQIGAETLFILTAVPKVALNFGKPDQVWLDHMTIREAERYLAEGHFPGGSMGPKIEAAVKFLKNGGQRVVITDIETLSEQFNDTLGTVITRD
ncbi:MAG: carbamate kinase [Candidatus Marinimicrobia bacterium]|nr:carbamate kinase [Candidatus Neomarinimicrobiota bacterium]MCF7839251.1 carbamate kinase [Candidatus Neomarinimicrobiota bacterium]MCF7902217.1 carbamate kinase [Candidatus Neomarinimicrobiota bacterium]